MNAKMFNSKYPSGAIDNPSGTEPLEKTLERTLNTAIFWLICALLFIFKYLW